MVMSVDWGQVLKSVEQAVMDILGSNWQIASKVASAQIGALVSVAQSIEEAANASPPTITPLEFESLKLSQKRAMSGVLQAFEAIGIVTAEQAAAAAWNVVAQALKAGSGLPFIV
jgi:hypothetical protein